MIKKLKFLSVVSFIIILFVMVVGVQNSFAVTGDTGSSGGASSTVTPPITPPITPPVIITPPPVLSSLKDITSFRISGKKVTIDQATKTIEITVPPGKPIVPFTPTIKISKKASIFPSSGTTLDFSIPQTYIVVAEDNSIQKYTAMLAVLPLSPDKEIKTFSIEGKKTKAIISEPYHTIDMILPKYSNLTNLVPKFSISKLATIDHNAGTPVDFTTPQVFTITAEDESTQAYTVNISAVPLSSEKFITSLTILRRTGVISEIDHTITVTVPKKTKVTSLVPKISFSKLATIDHTKGQARNFMTPQIYTVTAENGTKQEYKVTVIVDPSSSEKAITSFSFLGKDGTIDETKKTITVGLAKHTKVTKLKAQVVLSKFATLYPKASTSRNLTTPQIYTVIAEDGSKQDYTVTVNLPPLSADKQLTKFTVLGKDAVINETQKTITVTVPDNTSVKKIIPTINTSEFATVSPKSNVARNFTYPQTYTVKAENGSTQNYTASVTFAPETISMIDTLPDNTLFKEYSCEEPSNSGEKLLIFNGEAIPDEKNNKRALAHLSDVWSTVDGVNWKQESSDIKMGRNWEKMVVKIKENGKDVIYSFGSKYIQEENRKTEGLNDNKIYKSTDGINWKFVGKMPDMDRTYDKSVVYFKDKFWMIGSMDAQGIWSSSTGENWKQELTYSPFKYRYNYAYDRVSNSNGQYDSNSLGAYVINGKIWYLVYQDWEMDAWRNIISSGKIRIYSTSNGVDWNDEGNLVNAKDSKPFNILTNTNPFPVLLNDEIYIVSSDKNTKNPLVIKTSNGEDWYQVSTNDTKFYKDGNPRNYASVVVFNNKLWSIGGFDQITTPNDNSNDIWSSKDGNKWTQVSPKGMSSPGVADRWLAGAVSISTGSYEKSSSKAQNIKIEGEYDETGYFTNNTETQRTLGLWTITADKGGDNTGDVVISSLGFVGTDYKTSKNVQFSSLKDLQNINIYAGSEKVGSLKVFDGAFYDKTGVYAISKNITFDKDVIVRDGETVVIKMVADFPAPKYENFEMRAWLSSIAFKDGYSTPCKVYTKDTKYTKISPSRKIVKVKEEKKGEQSYKAVDLEINRQWNDSSLFTGNDQTQTNLGTFKLIGHKNGEKTADAIVSYFDFMGYDNKTPQNVKYSSLEVLKNITVYADGVKVGTISAFSTPFYDSSGNAISKRINLSNNITIKDRQTVTITLFADFSAPPKNQNFFIRTWLTGVGFKDSNSTPAKIYSEENETDNKIKIQGKILYYYGEV